MFSFHGEKQLIWTLIIGGCNVIMIESLLKKMHRYWRPKLMMYTSTGRWKRKNANANTIYQNTNTDKCWYTIRNMHTST